MRSAAVAQSIWGVDRSRGDASGGSGRGRDNGYQHGLQQNLESAGEDPRLNHGLKQQQQNEQKEEEAIWRRRESLQRQRDEAVAAVDAARAVMARLESQLLVRQVNCW